MEFVQPNANHYVLGWMSNGVFSPSSTLFARLQILYNPGAKQKCIRFFNSPKSIEPFPLSLVRSEVINVNTNEPVETSILVIDQEKLHLLLSTLRELF
jgi:hypothetical protein